MFGLQLSRCGTFRHLLFRVSSTLQAGYPPTSTNSGREPRRRFREHGSDTDLQGGEQDPQQRKRLGHRGGNRYEGHRKVYGEDKDDFVQPKKSYKGPRGRYHEPRLNKEELGYKEEESYIAPRERYKEPRLNKDEPSHNQEESYKDPRERYHEPRFNKEEPKYNEVESYMGPRGRYKEPRFSKEESSHNQEESYKGPRRYKGPRFNEKEPRHNQEKSYKGPRGRYKEPQFNKEEPRYSPEGSYKGPRERYKESRIDKEEPKETQQNETYEEPTYEEPTELPASSEKGEEVHQWVKSAWKMKQLRHSQHLMNLARKGKVSEAEQVLEQMKKGRLRPDVVVFNSILSAHARQGDFKQAFKTFNEVSYNI